MDSVDRAKGHIVTTAVDVVVPDESFEDSETIHMVKDRPAAVSAENVRVATIWQTYKDPGCLRASRAAAQSTSMTTHRRRHRFVMCHSLVNRSCLCRDL
jgi:hypothetical protein